MGPGRSHSQVPGGQSSEGGVTIHPTATPIPLWASGPTRSGLEQALSKLAPRFRARSRAGRCLLGTEDKLHLKTVLLVVSGAPGISPPPQAFPTPGGGGGGARGRGSREDKCGNAEMLRSSPFLNARSVFECLLNAPRVGRSTELSWGGTQALPADWETPPAPADGGRPERQAWPLLLLLCPADPAVSPPAQAILRFQGESWFIYCRSFHLDFSSPSALSSQPHCPLLYTHAFSCIRHPSTCLLT